MNLTKEEAWELYFAEHPEILASWAHQNGRWPPGYSPDPTSPDFIGYSDDEDTED
jgi:hypothetical protein